MISADDYEKLSNAKKESETKIESYKQCIAGYESRIKELTEERDNFNSYITNKILQLTNENEKLKKKVSNQSERIDELIVYKNKTIREKYELEVEASSLRTQLKDTAYMYENKLKNREAALTAANIDNRANNSFIKTLRSQAEEDTNKMKELRQKYEAVLKANEKLAAENSRLANDPKITVLNNELNLLKKQYRDLNNAYKSQKNELCKLKNEPYDDLKHKLEDIAGTIARIYNNSDESYNLLSMLAYDLKDYM